MPKGSWFTEHNKTKKGNKGWPNANDKKIAAKKKNKRKLSADSRKSNRAP